MAFQVEKINPLDLQSRKAVGVSIPFSAKHVFNSTYTTQDALKSNLINYFLTGKGERFLNPSLGTGIRELLFSQMTEDSRDNVSYEIRKGIADWFPAVVINDLQVIGVPDRSVVTVYLKYSVLQTNIQDELVINFEQ